jgi:putative aldouronate transport system substrate-binding protein
MQPRIAAGQALPDLMIIPPSWGNSGVFRLATQGMLTRLDPLFPLHAPDIERVLALDPMLKGMLTAPDGNIYTIADTPKDVNDAVIFQGMFIRQDWLDKLGLPIPVTLADWYNTLVAFRDGDPRGDGVSVVPFSGIGVWNALTVFAGAFGLPVGFGTDGWWYDENGNVINIYTMPEFREYLTTMNQWYNEGLFDPEINRDESNFQSYVSTNMVGAFVHLAERETQYDSFLHVGGFDDAKHTLVVHPSANRPLRVLKRGPTWSHYAIPTSSDKAEVVMQWVNFVWGTEEGVTFTEWGIEGVTWEWDGDKRRYTDFVLNNSDGLDPYNALRSLGIANTILVRTPFEIYPALNAGNSAVAYAERLSSAMTEPFPQVMATPEEQTRLDVIQPDINTFREESIARFFTGVDSMDNYDDFLATLDSIGLPELQAIRQAQFDRSGVK